MDGSMVLNQSSNVCLRVFPEYDRAGWLHAFPYGEVFVLGDDHGCFTQCMFPDATVIRVIQSDVIDVLGCLALSDKPPRKSRRQLGIDKEARHQATRNTG